MAIALQICRLRVRTGAGWQEPYDVDKSVVAIVGPVDTGKSSFLDCIAFGLGRDIGEFRGAVDRYLREVEVVIRVDQGMYLLRRARRTQSFVEIFDATGTQEGRFPVRMRQGEQTISDWLLQQLGLADDVASIRLPGGRSLDFTDAILPYCYLTQGDIDRHIVRPARDDASRLAALKLMLNLTSARAERLAGIIRDADNDIEREGRKFRTISDFLSGSAATHPDVLQAEVDRLSQAERVAARALARLRSEALTASPSGDPIRQQLVDARHRVAAEEEALDKVGEKRRAASERLTYLEDSLRALSELEQSSPDDRTTLRLALPRCPACEVDISSRLVQPAHCYLCREPLAGGDHRLERKRLIDAHQQLADELRQLNKQVEAAESQATRARSELVALLTRLNLEAGESISPYVDSIAAAAADLADIRASLAALSRVQDAHNRLQMHHDQLAELANEQAIRRQQVVEDPELERLEDVLPRLNAIFERVVAGIELPHATGLARIDSDTLLPLVDEQTFSQRGGGARAAVSVAYSLTLLTYTLENVMARVPSLLIIDSPQKNFGVNRDDRALAHRVYESFLDYMDDQSSWRQGNLQRPFQLIIVDNDLHPDIRKRIKVHQFTRQDGFIKGLADPHGGIGEPRQLEIDDIASDE